VFQRVRRLAAVGTLSIAVAGLFALTASPANAASATPQIQLPPSTTAAISQVSTQGPGGPLDEFVELQNVSASPLDISGWTVFSCSASGALTRLATVLPGTVLEPATPTQGAEVGSFYLLANVAQYSRGTIPDQTMTGNILNNGGVLLRNAQGVRIDSVGFSANNQCTQSVPAPQQTTFADQSDIRVSNTGVNGIDFRLITPAFPRNSSFTTAASTAIRVAA